MSTSLKFREIKEKIAHLSENERKEYWRNQTLVNRVHDDATVAVEYYTLIKFIKENYTDRIETIQMPYLHLISHCMELQYKIILELAIKYGYIPLKLDSIIHCHDLANLCEHILFVFKKIAQENSCSERDRHSFEIEFPKVHLHFVDLVKTDTTTYRYTDKRDKKGNVIKNEKFKNDADSPNMMDVLEAFDRCYDSLVYTIYVLKYIFPEIIE